MNLPPPLYELIQHLCGLPKTLARLAPHCRDLDGKTVLDVGGGTGLYSRLLPPTAHYICLDADASRLTTAQGVTGRLIRCDATQIALEDQSVDCAFCIAVAHHLPDEALQRMLKEVARVVRVRLIFLEPLLPEPSLASRVLRYMDDGKFFRTEAALRSALAADFSGQSTETYTIFHRYFLHVATPRAIEAPQSTLSSIAAK